MNRLREWVQSEWLTVRVQIALGAIFIAAALPKLADPPTFAKNVWAYGMVPDFLINAQALFMPSLEIVVGLALVLGLFPRAAASLCGILLVLFIVALSWSVITENPVNCSCFELDPSPKTCAELLGDMKWLILRDLGMLLMVAQILWVRGPKKE